MNTLKFKHLLQRLPVVRQQSETDCGAACLATICRYDGKYVSLNKLRELARVGQSGSSMYNLMQAAKALGYETTPILEIYENLEKSDRPSIVNWRGYHWIVVYRANDKYVTVADPAQGSIEIPKYEFLEDWTRYTLHLKPTEKVKEIEESKPTLNQFIPYIKPYVRAILEIGLASFVIQILAMVLPIFTKFVIDEVIVKQNSQWLYISLVAIAAISILNITISYFRQQLSLFVSMKVTLMMVTDFYKHVLALPISYFASRKVGDVTSRFGENQTIVSFFTDIGLQTFLNVISAMLYLCLMFYFNVSLTLVACLFLILHLVKLPSLRQQIGVVPQQSHLFRGTVRDNIARGKPNASLWEIIEAATLAHAHEFITNLPQGYDSIVEEEGSNFSGGQRQRLTIARALIRKPQILVLDEATSALDNVTEKIVLANIKKAFSERTIITIAHRLSTVRQADLIVVLDRGNILEMGTHDRLITNRNLYYYLSTQQLNL